MTLKQKRVLAELPKNGQNIAASMRKAGYSESSVRSGAVYNSIRRYTQKQDYYSEENIKREQMKALRRFRTGKDNSNYQRAIEHMARIGGIIIDKSENKTEVISAERQNELMELCKRRFPLSVDNSKIENTATQ